MKKKNYKIIIIINILIELLYFILSNILSNNEIYFRNFVTEFIYFNRLILIIVLLILDFIIIAKKYKENLFKRILYLVLEIVLSLYIFQIMILSYAFSIENEAFTYRHGTPYIAVAKVHGLHNTNIVFYQYINPLMMTPSNLDDFMYNGSYNCYEYKYSDYLKTPTIDLYFEHQFSELNPWYAKKKFSSDVFKYLGNQTYDFGKLIVKFNDIESNIKEAFIKDDIVAYKGKNIIGENIDIIKKHVEDTNNDLGIKINYREHRDENNNKNIRVIREDDYGTNYPIFSFIVNDENLISEVIYFNN